MYVAKMLTVIISVHNDFPLIFQNYSKMNSLLQNLKDELILWRISQWL